MIDDIRSRVNDNNGLAVSTFNTIGIGAIVLVVMVLIINIIAGFSMAIWLPLSVSAILIMVAYVGFSIAKKYSMGTVVLSLELNFLFFPLIFFANGGLSGNGILFFMVGIILSIIIFDDISLWLISFTEIFYYLVLIWMDIYAPNLITPIESIVLSRVTISLGLICSSIMAGNIFRILIKQNKNERKKIENLLKTDPLTKVYNRRYLMEVLDYYIKNKEFHPLSIVLFDIDNFKKVNDSFGHVEGDMVLKNFGKLLKEYDDEIIASRYGGEEFMVVMPNYNKIRATVRANDIRELAKKVIGVSSVVTVSGGVAEYKEGQTIESFTNMADENLYYAKNHGKNQIVN